jgi:hypothetical protein
MRKRIAADECGRFVSEKAMGTAFDERDALGDVRNGLDRVSLTHRRRRRNAVLERRKW